jgi:hypothetical protein
MLISNWPISILDSFSMFMKVLTSKEILLWLSSLLNCLYGMYVDFHDCYGNVVAYQCCL